MKRIISKAFLKRGVTKEQIISDETWGDIIKQGKSDKYEVYDIPERKLKEVPEIKIEKPKKVKSNG